MYYPSSADESMEILSIYDNSTHNSDIFEADTKKQSYGYGATDSQSSRDQIRIDDLDYYEKEHAKSTNFNLQNITNFKLHITDKQISYLPCYLVVSFLFNISLLILTSSSFKYQECNDKLKYFGFIISIINFTVANVLLVFGQLLYLISKPMPKLHLLCCSFIIIYAIIISISLVIQPIEIINTYISCGYISSVSILMLINIFYTLFILISLVILIYQSLALVLA